MKSAWRDLAVTGMCVNLLGQAPAAGPAKDKWTVVSCTSEETVAADNAARNAIDGDPGTLWHTRWGANATPYPHEIVIDLGEELTLTGFSYLPRQDGGVNGTVQMYEVAISTDGKQWGDPAAKGEFDAKNGAEQCVAFKQKKTGRFFKLRSLSASAPRSVTSVAELGVFTGNVPPTLPKPKQANKPNQHPVLLSVGDFSRITSVPRDKMICFTLYTVQNRVLKLSAQMYPLLMSDAETVTLEVRRNGTWRAIADADIHPIGWTATFRIEDWDASSDVSYRVRHAGGSVVEGLIRHDPVEENTIVAAVFTGNSPGPGGGAISKRDVVDNVLKLNPDVLLFTGDQVYDHTTHTASWLRFGETFGDLTRNYPTVCLPDDHDAGQGNLWGGGGRKVKIDTEGGYVRPAEYIKMMERQQTAHMPDPFDPTPIEQGIGVYYTALNIGGIDFALVEDRKFKSGCLEFDIQGKKLGPRPDHIDTPGYNPKVFDVPGKKLLGDRQLAFLDAWAKEWRGVAMKALVSQTVFSMTSTYHGSGKTFYYADFDANGWPQTGRNKAIAAIRRGYAFHICGDQHLATIGQYGITDFRDGGWWFCVPSIANLWPRWWQPKTEALRPAPGATQENTGDYVDGFGNRMTIYAHTNPFKTGREPAALHDRMPGFGVVTFDKSRRTIKMECWPRMTDPTDPAARQYPGWPRTIHQYDNNPCKAVGWLPEIRLKGGENPVVQVKREDTGEIEYTLRIQGAVFRPKTASLSHYSVTVSEPGQWELTLSGLTATANPEGVREVSVP